MDSRNTGYNNYDMQSEMESAYSTDCEHLNFVIRISNSLL